ncbi:MAG: hypothetical protein LBO75_01980 [Bifidobacteriaceae bacterium]|jgi:predicted AAA+ superfamily ATPase|nr:hypothetical protein [Bifidobacteriaceae bacterium]
MALVSGPQWHFKLVSPDVTLRRGGRARHEVDLILEYPRGLTVGIEIKATASPDHWGTKHLQWLRDRLGDKFTAGIVLHTGTATIDFGQQIWALPISALWHW